MTHEEILIKIKSRTSSRCHHALDIIYAVCLEQVEREIADFSYATIARLGASRGAPKAQSIRNKTGEHYQALIKSFAESASIRKPLGRKKPSESWIDEIKDPKLKLLVSVQASELRDANRLLKEIIPPNMEIIIDDRNYSKSRHHFTDSERRALEYLLSEEFIHDSRFQLGERGDLIDNKGNRVFKPGTFEALRKALQYL